MRHRMICVALAGLAMLASAAPSPAATKRYQCTDTTAVTSAPLRLTAACTVNVTCPLSAASCAVTYTAFGRGVPLINVIASVDGSNTVECSGLFSCQTIDAILSPALAPGGSVSLSVVSWGNPVGLLSEARLVAIRTDS
jgi:hypothetical protein